MIKNRLSESPEKYTKGELRIIRELLENYPTAALGTAASLASRAHVSSPTVIRFAAKLGYDGFADFQRALMSELSDTMKSPLSMIEQRKSQIEDGDIYGRYLESAIGALQHSFGGSLFMDLKRTVKLLADPRKHVKCVGGRFTHCLATILHTHLYQLHGAATLLSNERAELFDQLVDINHRDVIIAFDYRRYQTDIVDFCNQAKAQKATIVIFTDQYRSPIAKIADIVITTPVEVVSPYDTMVPALAIMEALIAGLTGQLADSSRERLAKLETYRDRNKITISSN